MCAGLTLLSLLLLLFIYLFIYSLICSDIDFFLFMYDLMYNLLSSKTANKSWKNRDRLDPQAGLDNSGSQRILHFPMNGFEIQRFKEKYTT